MTKRLTKSIDKKVSGVCGGLAKYFDLDPPSCVLSISASPSSPPGSLASSSTSSWL